MVTMAYSIEVWMGSRFEEQYSSAYENDTPVCMFIEANGTVMIRTVLFI